MSFSTDNREKIIDKISKLLALTRSSNENESALAAQKVQQMLQEYNISESEVGGEKSSIGILAIDYMTSNERTWEVRLLAVLSEAYFCRALFNDNEMDVIGRKLDAEVTRDVFSSIRSSLIDLSYLRMKQYGDSIKRHYSVTDLRKLKGINRTTEFRRSWLDGTIIGVNDKIKLQNVMFGFKYGNRATALVSLRKEEVDEKISKMDIGYGDVGDMGDNYLARDLGIKDGKNVSFSRGELVGEN